MLIGVLRVAVLSNLSEASLRRP